MSGATLQARTEAEAAKGAAQDDLDLAMDMLSQVCSHFAAACTFQLFSLVSGSYLAPEG